jgi:hypothetical protein
MKMIVNGIAGRASAHYPAGLRRGIHLMNQTTKFFLSSAVEGYFYQTAFFMFVHDIARLAALGKSPKAAFEAAHRAVANLALSDSETAQFEDLMMIWHDDRHIETSFLMSGQTRSTKVSWLRIDRYPTVS